MNTLDYNSIGQRAYATAQEKGWYAEGGPDFGTRIALIHSEASETLEAYRNNWICSSETLSYLLNAPTFEHDFFVANIKSTVGDELADVVIRCCEALAHFVVDANAVKIGDMVRDTGNSFGDAICRLHSYIGLIHFNKHQKEQMHGYMVKTAIYAGLIAKTQNIDIASHIEAKLRYNTMRPHKHGGKKF